MRPRRVIVTSVGIAPRLQLSSLLLARSRRQFAIERLGALARLVDSASARIAFAPLLDAVRLSFVQARSGQVFRRFLVRLAAVAGFDARGIEAEAGVETAEGVLGPVRKGVEERVVRALGYVQLLCSRRLLIFKRILI